jgi:hypothetical protein
VRAWLVLLAVLGVAWQASAAVTFQGTVQPSTPALQQGAFYYVGLLPGYRVVATLTWQDTSGGLGFGNDLDLNVERVVRFDDPEPEDVVAYATCQDGFARTHPGGAREHLDWTVPESAPAGAYGVYVLGFLVTSPQPFELDLAVRDPEGFDVTEERLGHQGPFIQVVDNHHCDVLP